MDLFPEENHYVIPYLLQSIASRAKNMSDLQIMDESVTKQQFTLMSMSEEMVSAIAKMTKLKTLRVRHFSISFSSLMELCRMLPSLKTLYFKIEAEPNFKIDDIQVFQKSFGSLEIFQFSPVSNESKLDEDFRKSLTLQCICYLTNLRIVGDPESVVDMLPTCLEINQLTEDEWKSKLTHLTLYLDKHVEENALTKFPDVMLMDIWEDKTNADYMVSGLLQFQHLTQLFMSDLDIYKSDCIVQFLEVYGESLTQLILQFKLCPIDFVLLFNMICCSSFDSLELLAMRNLDVQPPCDAYPQIGEISCKSLNELDLEFTIEQSYYPTHVHLSKILSVPTLERVKLTRVPTTLFELWETMVSKSCVHVLCRYLNRISPASIALHNLWIKMEQSDSTSTNPENGLNVLTVLTPDEKYYNLIKHFMNSTEHLIIENEKLILIKECPNLKKIDIAKIMDLIPQGNHWTLTDMLITIASNATNMSDFQIMDGSANITLRVMSEEMISAIAKMSKLKILMVRHFSISFSSLMKLCRNLPSLKTLYFKIEAEPNFKIYDMKDFQKSFGHLEIFQFSSVSNESGWGEKFRKSLTLKCIRYLPNLRILGDPEYFVDMLHTCLAYQSLAYSKESKLTRLEIRVDRNIRKNALTKFPNVIHLRIKWVEDEEPSLIEYKFLGLLEFRQLTQLVMSDLGINYSLYLNQFLMVYGERMEILILEFSSHQINFVLLFNMICCRSFHNLQLLTMTNLDVRPYAAHPKIDPISCESLKQLELHFISEQSSNPTYVHLSIILSVPNLEKVRLFGVPTTTDELWETMLLVNRRSILKNVTHFLLELSNVQMIEGELFARNKCCQTIEKELQSGV
ncbi:Hypothetical predicted protein [Cloeon dipterum]|uniref:Uncharacterized protein n=1 Tax=Cloeon dipterum TaxID=197152 RepID=A0A8S1C9P1_9INSE|nr:Hypothetical predicted protein [Cloeon dipterum]